MSHDIGTELEHQNVMLDELGNDMENQRSKTDTVLKKMAQITHLDSDAKQWKAIIWLGIAIFVLIVLNLIF